MLNKLLLAALLALTPATVGAQSGPVLRSDLGFSIGGAPASSFTVSGTFTPPAGVTSVWALIMAAGGGGAASVPGNNGGGGGAAGQAILARVTVSGPITVTIGAAGAAGTASGDGGNGGNTLFGGITAQGGPGGKANATGGLGAANGGTGPALNSGVNAGAGGLTMDSIPAGLYSYGGGGGGNGISTNFGGGSGPASNGGNAVFAAFRLSPGYASVTNGSGVASGIGTTWTTLLSVGSVVMFPGDQSGTAYTIVSGLTNTSFTFTPTYKGTTNAAIPIVLSTGFSGGLGGTVTNVTNGAPAGGGGGASLLGAGGNGGNAGNGSGNATAGSAAAGNGSGGGGGGLDFLGANVSLNGGAGKPGAVYLFY